MASIHTLIAQYAADNSKANAKKVLAKITHHPMSACLLDGAGVIIMNTAVKHARGIVIPDAQVTPFTTTMKRPSLKFYIA